MALDRLGEHGTLEPTSDINVTSLVDVAFVLLIIFMITAPIMQGGVEVELPRAESRPLQSREGLVVSIDREGKIFVDDNELSYQDFRMTFGALSEGRDASGVYLRADSRVPYGDVVRVLAVMRASGTGNVGMVVEPERIE
jgi:biopolymer transport protein ExbD/biopolymer transport protein TolR